MTTAPAPRALAILGSTGSIGRSTLDVVRHNPNRFRVVALTGGRNAEMLLAQAREFRPERVGLADPDAARAFRAAWPAADGAPPEILDGPEVAREIAAQNGATVVVNGLVGGLGLEPTLEALARGATVALANKEPLVIAGEIVMAAARAGDGELLPLDSELSAIHQCLRGNEKRAVRRVILTASGGPFRALPIGEFDSITVEDALAHPTWNMGKKITIDSATLMNKGLEVIETRWYFDLPYERIGVVVHPESLVHSMVEYVDHSVMAQISEPDMRLPIQYALTYPERLPSRVAPLDLTRAGTLTFREPDLARFPCLRLAREAGEAGGTAPAVLNAANEVAVAAFLDREIGFTEIPGLIEACLERCAGTPEPELANFLAADGFTREEARRILAQRGAQRGARPAGTPAPPDTHVPGSAR